MARYINQLPLTKDPQILTQMIGDYLTREGFVNKTYNGELIWQKGVGIMAAPQFIKFGFARNSVVVEAWLKYAILPGVYLGEQNLKGIFGFALKSILKTRVKSVESIVLYQLVISLKQNNYRGVAQFGREIGRAHV